MRVHRVCAAALIAVLVCGPGDARGRAQTPAPTRPAQPTQGTGAISGVVVDGSTGRPVPGARVTLGGLPSRLVFTSASVTPPGLTAESGRTIITDELGRFVFTALPAFDNYTLSAEMNGYLRSGFGQNAPAADRSASSRRIVLADGQWLNDARVNVWLAGSIAGRVVDEAGEPAVNVPVRALKHVLVSGRVVLAVGPTTRTDDRGSYRLGGLEPGRYLAVVPSVQASVRYDVPVSRVPSGLLAFTPDPSNRLLLDRYFTPPPTRDGRLLAYPSTFYPAAQTAADAVTIELAPAQRVDGADIHLTAVPSVTVSGVVDGPMVETDFISPPQHAGAGMTLRLMVAGTEELGPGHEAATALVGMNGSFTFLNVPSGRYTLIASRATAQFALGSLGLSEAWSSLPSAPGSVTASPSYVAAPVTSGAVRYYYSAQPGPVGYNARMSLVVGDSDVRDVVIPLRPPVTISGTIAWDGEPPPGDATSVSAVPAYLDPSLSVLTVNRVSRAPGSTFIVAGVAAGEYVLRFGSFTVKSIVTPLTDYTHRPLDVSDGRGLADVLVTLTTKVAHLNGLVRNEQGTPADAVVIAFPVDRARWMGYGAASAEIVSDRGSTDGTWRATLPGGDYFVIAVDGSLAGAWSDPAFLDAASAVATRVSVDWGESKSLDLTVKPVRWR